jgi:hypothetical protein
VGVPAGGVDLYGGAGAGLWRISGTYEDVNAYGSIREGDSGAWRLGYRFCAGARREAGPGMLQVEVAMRRSALRSMTSAAGHTVVPVAGFSGTVGYLYGF